MYLGAEPRHSASGTPASPYTQQAAAAAQGEHSSSSSSSTSSHAHRASAQMAGLKRRAAIRMQAQQPQEPSPTPDQGHPGRDAQNMASTAAAATPPLHASPASADAHTADLRAQHAASAQYKHTAAAADSGAAGPGSGAARESLHEADSLQEANGAVPWRRRHSTARSTFAGGSAVRVSIVGHQLADIDIVKCMRELSSHISWR